MRKFIVLLLSILWVAPCFAATRYVGSGETYTTIPAGIAATEEGDTLIIKDGTYSADISTLPTGSSGSYCKIQAENDGGVVVTGALQLTLGSAGEYCEISGIKFSGSSSKQIYAPHTKWFRCSFAGGPTCSSNCDGAINLDVFAYQLFEDCWFYGTGGRYSVGAIDSSGTVHDIVFRRCVVRHDGGYTADEGNPEAAFVIYGGYNVSVQNVIIIDTVSTNTHDPYDSDFYLTNHSGYHEPVGIEYLGCMVINGIVGGIFSDFEVGSNDDIEITDFLMLGGDDGLAVWPNGSATVNFTSTRISLYGLTTDSGAVSCGTNGHIYLTDSCFWNHDDVGSVTTVSYTNAYNPDSFSGTGVTHIDPSSSWLYGPRIEDGSTLKTGGSSNGQRGAQITKKIGVSGTLYGEDGYKTEQEGNLWPWPYEDRIKTDMAAVSTRGFCATGKQVNGTDDITLTSYIWEYLGNAIPSDIYGETPATPKNQGIRILSGGFR